MLVNSEMAYACSRAYAALTAAAVAAPPVAALVLGSGMGSAIERLSRRQSVPFLEVPGLASPSVPGHEGRLTWGEWAGQPVLVFEGRLHFYEGHPWRSVVAPIQTAAFLGAKVIVLTNAAGGIRDDLQPGALMAIREHVEWTRPDCWRNPNVDASPYSPRLRRLIERAAQARGTTLHEGVYAAVTGPSYETPAEIRALKAWGADVVGMSTAREARAACDLGLECTALSCVTNRAAGLSAGPIHHDEVLHTAAAQAGRLTDLLEAFVRLL